MEWSQTYGKLCYYRGIWMDDFLLCVLFSSPSPMAVSRKPAAEGGGAVTARGTRTFRHTPWWPLTVIRSLYEVFYRKSEGYKESWISSLLLGSSNIQEEYFIPTQGAKARCNIWEAIDDPYLPHRVQSHPSTRWNYHYSHRANILPTGQKRILRRISETDTTKASSWPKRSILAIIFWEEYEELIGKWSKYFFTEHTNMNYLYYHSMMYIQFSLCIFSASFFTPFLGGAGRAWGRGLLQRLSDQPRPGHHENKWRPILAMRSRSRSKISSLFLLRRVNACHCSAE